MKTGGKRELSRDASSKKEADSCPSAKKDPTRPAV
jgi:hypothetical protein